MPSSDHTLSWPASLNASSSGPGGVVSSLAMVVLSLPALLWRFYVDYLWDPAPGSWVSRSAYTFRILAYFVIAPFILLTLLDVTSYVIARTLGVVETTGASTTDKVTITIDELASVAVGAGAVRGSDVGSEEEEEGEGRRSSADGRDSDNLNDVQFKMKIELDGTQTQQQQPHPQAPSSPPAYFFSPTEENNLDLSGANILSPAASRQGSPGVERRMRELPPVSETTTATTARGGVGAKDNAVDADADADDASGSTSAASTDSFAVVEHEQPAGLRRRAGVSEAQSGVQALRT